MNFIIQVQKLMPNLVILKQMKNKDFDSFNNDRILAARKRVIDLLYLIGSWEEQKNLKQKNDSFT